MHNCCIWRIIINKKLIGFADLNWAGDTTDRNSTQVSCFKFWIFSLLVSKDLKFMKTINLVMLQPRNGNTDDVYILTLSTIIYRNWSGSNWLKLSIFLLKVKWRTFLQRSWTENNFQIKKGILTTYSLPVQASKHVGL